MGRDEEHFGDYNSVGNSGGRENGGRALMDLESAIALKEAENGS